MSMSRGVAVLTVVALGGMAGTGLRFGVAEFASGRGWPPAVALLVVNTAGAFALGWFVEWRTRHDLGDLVVALVSAGILASFTTFSGVMVEAAELVRDSEVTAAALLLAASLGSGWLSAVAGRRLASR
jgi:fluoride ion exporter CrcB/FEX